MDITVIQQCIRSILSVLVRLLTLDNSGQGESYCHFERTYFGTNFVPRKMQSSNFGSIAQHFLLLNTKKSLSSTPHPHQGPPVH